MASAVPPASAINRRFATENIKRLNTAQTELLLRKIRRWDNALQSKYERNLAERADARVDAAKAAMANEEWGPYRVLKEERDAILARRRALDDARVRAIKHIDERAVASPSAPLPSAGVAKARRSLRSIIDDLGVVSAGGQPTKKLQRALTDLRHLHGELVQDFKRYQAMPTWERAPFREKWQKAYQQLRNMEVGINNLRSELIKRSKSAGPSFVRASHVEYPATPSHIRAERERGVPKPVSQRRSGLLTEDFESRPGGGYASQRGKVLYPWGALQAMHRQKPDPKWKWRTDAKEFVDTSKGLFRVEDGWQARVTVLPDYKSGGQRPFVWEVYGPKDHNPRYVGRAAGPVAAKRAANAALKKVFKSQQMTMFGQWSTPYSLLELRAEKDELSERIRHAKESRYNASVEAADIEVSLDRLREERDAASRTSARERGTSDISRMRILREKLKSARNRAKNEERRLSHLIDSYDRVDRALSWREGALMEERDRAADIPEHSQYVDYPMLTREPGRGAKPRHTRAIRDYAGGTWYAVNNDIIRRKSGGFTASVGRQGVNTIIWRVAGPRGKAVAGTAATPAAAKRAANRELLTMIRERQTKMPFAGALGMLDPDHRRRFIAHTRPIGKLVADFDSRLEKGDCKGAHRTYHELMKRTSYAIEASHSLVAPTSRSDQNIARLRGLRKQISKRFQACVLR